jgi:hypothetical protein
MSAVIQEQAVELLWRQWTSVGVAGVAKPAEQAIDLEALIAFTPFVAAADPRLEAESIDWCVRIGKTFISISRLRQIVRLMPPRPTEGEPDLPSMLLDKVGGESPRVSEKSRLPSLQHPSLLQLRSRYIFGVGARADVLANLVMRGRVAGAQRASALRPTGYTKQTVMTVLDELAQAAVLVKLGGSPGVTYELVKEAPLRSLLSPLPRRMPSWTERFIIVASILSAWRRFGNRATYAVELAKVLEGLHKVVAAVGQEPPRVGRPARLLREVDRWAVALLEDRGWEDTWMFGGDDVAAEILDSLYDAIAETVQRAEHGVGAIELDELCFEHVDRRKGSADFTVRVAAQHPRADASFDGRVEGTFRFDPTPDDKEAFLDSLKLVEARAHFDVDEDD